MKYSLERTKMVRR